MIPVRHRAAGGDVPGRDVEFWDSAAAQTLGCYLHAAALSGLPVSLVRAWLAGPAHSITAAEILATHPTAARQAAATLGILDPRPSKTAEVIRYMAAEAFAHATSHGWAETSPTNRSNRGSRLDGRRCSALWYGARVPIRRGD